MIIEDEVYGPHSVQEPLLLDLLGSQAIQRLRHISQAGASSLVRTGRSVTRFEHSVGVMLLTRFLGGTTLEQAAGLLQDVSHTAFSHTVDYVFRDREEQFHENIFEVVLSNSDIPSTLARHGLHWRNLFEPANLRIVDAKAPLLCADRIDYTLRDLVRFGHINAGDAQNFIQTLSFQDTVIVCSDVDSAERFVRWYAYLVENLFMNPLELYAHDEFAAIIRSALQQNVLTINDLRDVDATVVSKLELHCWSRERLATLRTTKKVALGDGVGARRVFSKGRIINPPILCEGSWVPLSHLRPDIEALWKNIVTVSSEGLLVRSI